MLEREYCQLALPTNVMASPNGSTVRLPLCGPGLGFLSAFKSSRILFIASGVRSSCVFGERMRERATS